MCVVTETNVIIFQLNYGFLNVLSSVVRVIFCLLRYVSAEARGNSVLEYLSWCVVPLGHILQMVMSM